MRFLALAAALAGCARAAHVAAVYSEGLALGSLACDAKSTSWAVGHGGSENNPLMGSSPGTVTILSYFGVGGAGTVLANRHLPDGLRVVLNSAIVIGEVWAVSSNQSWEPVCGLGDR